ncbi:MAG: bifunctional phosphoserine phosphatase/homoserine phosphotransferase ThrH [Spirochaetales bacterium]|nr:bifunctional phosphoserine phosphatase/homoserine phosphotransferase ThrH [Spirochaetales bacterium]
MTIACLDMEGVLLPEIWIGVSEKTGIKELSLTTRDISDYDKLMQYRIKILRENNIKMADIENVISTLSPLDGAKDFLKRLQQKMQCVILSDTFYQFAMPLMKQLDYPTLFCHDLIIDEQGFVADYKLRMKDSKREAVKHFHALNFRTVATGDSYNDTTMLSEADAGILFRPPQRVIDEFPQFKVVTEYDDLYDAFVNAL